MPGTGSSGVRSTGADTRTLKQVLALPNLPPDLAALMSAVLSAPDGASLVRALDSGLQNYLRDLGISPYRFDSVETLQAALDSAEV